MPPTEPAPRPRRLLWSFRGTAHTLCALLAALREGRP